MASRVGRGGSPYGSGPWLAFAPTLVGLVAVGCALLTVSSRHGMSVLVAAVLLKPGVVLVVCGALVSVGLMVLGAVRQWPTDGRLWLPVVCVPIVAVVLVAASP